MRPSHWPFTKERIQCINLPPSGGLVALGYGVYPGLKADLLAGRVLSNGGSQISLGEQKLLLNPCIFLLPALRPLCLYVHCASPGFALKRCWQTSIEWSILHTWLFLENKFSLVSIYIKLKSHILFLFCESHPYTFALYSFATNPPNFYFQLFGQALRHCLCIEIHQSLWPSLLNN